MRKTSHSCVIRINKNRLFPKKIKTKRHHLGGFEMFTPGSKNKR
jgi:hypothetical protein